MRAVLGRTTRIWISANETYAWAHRPGAAWPGSQLSGKRIFAEFGPTGDLLDYTINGRNSVIDMDSNEFNAITSDFRPRICNLY